MKLSNELSLYLQSQKNIDFIKLTITDVYMSTAKLTTIAKVLLNFNKHIIAATALDQPYKSNRFQLYYIFVDYLTTNRFYLRFSTSLIAESLVSLYSSCLWLEREVFDLYGLYFSTNENTDLRRILTDYHFKGHPLRKDFALIGYNEKIYSQLTKSIKDKKELIF